MPPETPYYVTVHLISGREYTSEPLDPGECDTLIQQLTGRIPVETGYVHMTLRGDEGRHAQIRISTVSAVESARYYA